MADAADDKPESWWQRNGDYVWEVIGYIAALLVIVAFFTSYGVVFGIFKSVGDGRKVDVFRNVIDNSTVAQPLLNVTCTLSVTDSKYGVDVSLDLNCTTGLPDAIVLNTLFLATPFNVIFNRQLSTFSEGDVPGIVSQTIPWASGSVQDYPFDSYYADLSVRSVRGSLARSLIDLSECASLSLTHVYAPAYVWGVVVYIPRPCPDHEPFAAGGSHGRSRGDRRFDTRGISTPTTSARASRVSWLCASVRNARRSGSCIPCG